MKNLAGAFCMAVLLYVTACSQVNTRQSSSLKSNNMDTALLTNETVKKAFDAWQKGDKNSFLALFTPNVALYDDGNSRDFQGFVKEACGHEKFISLTKVENEGLDIYGNFHTERWGDFKTCFKFKVKEDGKIYRLDIGQAK